MTGQTQKKPAEGSKPPAKSPRRRARELAMQGIYQWRLSGADAAQVAQRMQDEKNLGRYDLELFDRLLRGVLLLGAYELAHVPEVPYRVVINEAVELAKSYGGTDGHKFVNGVLDKLAPVLRPHEAAR